MLTFSERLALLKNSLREKGKSQEAVAKALNCNQAKVSLALSGNKEVPMAFLLEILNEAEYPIEKIFPEITSQLKEVVKLLEKGASQQATVTLLNLMKLTNYYDRPQEDTKATG